MIFLRTSNSVFRMISNVSKYFLTFIRYYYGQSIWYLGWYQMFLSDFVCSSFKFCFQKFINLIDLVWFDMIIAVHTTNPTSPKHKLFFYLSRDFCHSPNSTSTQPQLTSTELGLTWKWVCTPPPTPPWNSTSTTRRLRSTFDVA